MYHHFTALFHSDIDDFDILVRLVSFVRLHVFDCMDNLQSRENPPKHSVFVVQPRRRRGCDEELRTVRAWTRVRHANGVRPREKGRRQHQTQPGQRGSPRTDHASTRH